MQMFRSKYYVIEWSEHETKIRDENQEFFRTKKYNLNFFRQPTQVTLFFGIGEHELQ